jgi:hypothetical protein
MYNKIVKTRKNHICDVCECKIEAGSKAEFLSFRTGSYGVDDKQIGIIYHKFYACISCCEKAEIDLKNNINEEPDWY